MTNLKKSQQIRTLISCGELEDHRKEHGLPEQSAFWFRVMRS